jgi:diacylglycerol kinase (ATP)
VSGIGVITNPRSKANQKDPASMRQLGYLLGSAGSPYATKSLDDLYRAAEEFKRAQIDILGINGGDGTIHVTLTAFAKVYGETPLPQVAILPGGTLNTIAAGIGLRGKPQDVLYEVIERYHQGEELPAVERHLLQVNGQVGFIFGNGMIANFLGAYYATGKPSPSMGARLVGKAVFGAAFHTAFARSLSQRWVGQVTVDGEAWAQRDFAAVTGATVTEIGLGFKPYHRALEKPGHFAILGIHCSPLALSLELGRIQRGRPVRRDKAISQVAREVLVESDEPFAYTIDGDLYRGATRLLLRTGPKLRLLVP